MAVITPVGSDFNWSHEEEAIVKTASTDKAVQSDKDKLYDLAKQVVTAQFEEVCEEAPCDALEDSVEGVDEVIDDVADDVVNDSNNNSIICIDNEGEYINIDQLDQEDYYFERQYIFDNQNIEIYHNMINNTNIGISYIEISGEIRDNTIYYYEECISGYTSNTLDESDNTCTKIEKPYDPNNPDNGNEINGFSSLTLLIFGSIGVISIFFSTKIRRKK